jgi:hypothetical protein
MATKVYLSGDVVVVDKLGSPPVVNILVTQCKYQLIAVIEHENAEVIDYKNISIIDYVNNIVITDLVTEIQDVGGVPIGNLNEVIKYLSGFINIGDFNIVEQEQGGGGGGEVNTASNVGTGEGVFKNKVALDLVFRSLKAGTNISFVSSIDEIEINASGPPVVADEVERDSLYPSPANDFMIFNKRQEVFLNVLILFLGFGYRLMLLLE